MSGSPTRITSLDVARGIAIFLSLLNHGLSSFGGWAAVGSIATKAIRLGSQVATPTFLILFGVMLELAYARFRRDPGPALANRRLRRRALECYLGYLFTIAGGAATGAVPLAQAACAALFLDDLRFGNILKFYVVGLLVAVPALAVRERWGLAPLVIAAIAAWAVVPVLNALPWPPFESPWAHLTGLLFGRPVGRSFISLGHGGLLVVVGMLVGATLRSGTGTTRERLCAVTRRIGIAAAAIVIALCVVDSPRATLAGFLSGRYRGAHHIGYYAIGTLEAMLLLYGLARWQPHERVPGRWSRPLLLLGRWSLTSFAVGSGVLNAVPRGVTLGLVGSWGLTLGWIAITIAGLDYLDRRNAATAQSPPG